MKLWLVCFFLVFFSIEGLQWMTQFSWWQGAELSLPMAVGGGALLAIVSNYRFWQVAQRLPPATDHSATSRLPTTSALAPTSPTPASTPKKQRSISFEIRK